MKSSTEILRELFVDMAYDIQSICDEYAEKNNIPTKTINEYLDD